VWSQKALDLRDESLNAIEDVYMHMNECMFHHALARLWKFIHSTNAYFHGQEPWKVAKANLPLFKEILSATCHSLRTIAILLLPVMPHKMEELLASLGTPFNHAHDTLENMELTNWNKTFTLKKIPTLFEKPIGEATEEGQLMSQPEEVKVVQDNFITIDDLAKIELITGTIEACMDVAGYDKLLQLTVDLGAMGKRTIFSGIKKWYAPAELVGKRGLFAANLKPRKMAGSESHGMMMMPEDESGKPQLVQFPESIKNGVRLK
jgi:methionyl-tRNA synthetase